MPTFTGIVVKKTEIKIEQFWTIRGIHINPFTGAKEVECEEEMDHAPDENDIATFINNKRGLIDFVSVIVNYREAQFLPFEEGKSDG